MTKDTTSEGRYPMTVRFENRQLWEDFKTLSKIVENRNGTAQIEHYAKWFVEQHRDRLPKPEKES